MSEITSIGFKKRFKRLFFVLFILILPSCSLTLPPEQQRPLNWATLIPSTQLQNFYQVDSKLYRSAQPTHTGMVFLEEQGIKHVLNLRYFHSDRDEASGTTLQLHQVPMLAHYITYPQLVQALRIIKQADGSVIVHCLHGSDRTGTVVAAYRMVFQGWSKAEAIHELKRGGYGFHYALFPNIPEFLEGLDITKLRNDVKHNTSNVSNQ